MKLQKGKIVNIQVYKNNGLLYRQWNGVKVIDVSPHLWVFLMYKTKVSEKRGQKWVVREPYIWWMPTKQFYNTTGLIRSNGIYFYTNLASPPFFEDNTVKYIDYDLDIKAYPESAIKIVDKNEYNINKIKYNYSIKTQKIIEKTVTEVIKYIKEKKYFFNKKNVKKYIYNMFKEKLLPKKINKYK